MLEKFQMAGFILLCLVLAYWMYRMWANDWATTRMCRYWDFFTTRMTARGYTLDELPTGGDASPCEVKFSIESDTVRIHAPSWDIYQLVKKIDAGKITKEQLEAKSHWPSTPMPL